MPYRLSLTVWAAAAIASAGIEVSSKRLDTLAINGVKVPGRWEMSYPTVQCDGQYMAYDTAGKSPRVYFTGTKGGNTSWDFVGQKPSSRDGGFELAGPRFRRVSSEVRGYTLTLQAREGAFKGWFLGRKDGELVLVKDASEAVALRLEVRRVGTTGK